ncbi:hypothetical protein ACFV2N_31155 [Streptomyces sp. NPDC059680]|uniref:hypothetical protein n=1 Tax=Streptomyces TaxID=1883 RepID=UPI001E2F7BD3|nr:hypothetical protein [Streptomyces barringtoniae]MCC5474537.1 hypothetical protein [Streptomyces barringtoniae]
MPFKSRTTFRALAVAAVTLVPLSSVSPAAQANSVKPSVLKPTACNGQTKGHIVKWYAPHVPFARIPLRCGTATGFGFNKIHAKHWEPFVDENIANTLANPTTSYQQDPNTRVFLLKDLPPCDSGQYRVVVSYLSYGSTGIKGIITAYHEDHPAAARRC